MKVAELMGAELDYWAGIADGLNVEIALSGECLLMDDNGDEICDEYSPSTNWEYGGPIIEREKITIEPNPYGQKQWGACHGPHGKEPTWIWKNAETALIAAMRCFVASKFGDDVPNEA